MKFTEPLAAKNISDARYRYGNALTHLARESALERRHQYAYRRGVLIIANGVLEARSHQRESKSK
jgi:hypothetical protein